MAEKKDLTDPDLARGISLTDLTDRSMLQGHARSIRTEGPKSVSQKSVPSQHRAAQLGRLGEGQQFEGERNEVRRISDAGSPLAGLSKRQV